MIHMSRLSEEIVFGTPMNLNSLNWDDAFATGSSIMPQKKTPILQSLFAEKPAEYLETNEPDDMLKGLRFVQQRYAGRQACNF